MTGRRAAALGALLAALAGAPAAAGGPTAAGEEHPGRALEVAGGLLSVEIEGTGPPLVLLPAGPGLDHAYFHPYLSSLASRATLVYVDPRGCGRSPARRPADYTLAAMVEDLEAVRAALGFERIDLLGHGLGGAVAALYADRHPGRVRSILLVGASPEPRSLLDAPGLLKGMTPEMQAAAGALAGNRYLSPDGRLRERLRIAAPLLFRRLTDRSFQRAFVERLTTSADVRDAVAAALAAGASGTDLRAALGRLRIPVLVAAGRHDPTATVEEAEAVRAAVPGARLAVFEESGAFPFAEQPVDFDRAARAFLSEASGAGEKGRAGAGGGI